MRSKHIKITLLALAALIAFAAFTSTASAGSYKVYSCQHPDGSVAPVDGWTVAANTGPYVAANNNCATPGGPGLQALFTSTWTHYAGEYINWTFAPNRKILAFDVWRAGSVSVTHPAYVNAFAQWFTSSPGGSTAGLGTIIDNGTIGSLAAGVSNTNKISKSGLDIPANTTSFTSSARCQGSSGLACSPSADPAIAAWVFRADFVLEDNDFPTATTPTGSLVANGGTHAGIEGVQFTATDSNYSATSGSGIYRATIEVDGQVVQSVVPNDNGGKCATIGADSTYNDFDYIQPCPASTPVSIELDTKALTDGAHSLKIKVYDAAGNSNTVYGPASFTTKNAPITPPNPGASGNNGNGGNLSTAQFSSSSAKGNLVRTKYGRKINLSTQLVDSAGAPITGAAVDVFEWVNVAGATEARVTTLQSDGNGYVVYVPRTTANKLVTFKWSKQIGSSSYQATDATTLIVSGSLRLKAKHRKLRSHGKLQLAGKLYGENMPKSVPVQIQTKQGKKWRVVAIVNTKKNGTYKWNYRFKFTSRGKFAFRAVVRKSSDLSVEAAASKAVKVKVG